MGMATPSDNLDGYEVSKYYSFFVRFVIQFYDDATDNLAL